jgi:hypothetical protein
MTIDQELLGRTKRTVTELCSQWSDLEDGYDIEFESSESERSFCGEVASMLDEILDLINGHPSPADKPLARLKKSRS